MMNWICNIFRNC